MNGGWRHFCHPSQLGYVWSPHFTQNVLHIRLPDNCTVHVRDLRPLDGRTEAFIVRSILMQISGANARELFAVKVAVV